MPSPSEPTIETRVSDAAPQNWVDRIAPSISRPYLRLARADRPIGTWLLLWPCLWSLLLALTIHPISLPEFARLVVLFGIGAFVMRGAGCTYNDIVDRDIDAEVERTRSRPLPSGQVNLLQAWMFLGGLSLIGLAVLLSLTSLAIWIGLGSLALIAAYPFMKRLTYWPQIWLGLTFNWGALVGYAAVTNTLSPAPLLLYLGAIFWTVGYDTIYAHQDKEDDLLVGVKSTALRLGNRTKYWLGVFYGASLAFFLLAGVVGQLGAGFYLGLIACGSHLLRQIRRVDIEDSAVCLAVFKSNRDFGALLAGSIGLGLFF